LAKFDQGGGCPCGLYRECEPNCEHKEIKMSWDNVGPNHCNMDETPIQRTVKMKNDDNDFGFTFADEESFIKSNNSKLVELRAMIIPLLNNLKKNPDKDIIQWPGKDRVKRIDAFIEIMDKLIYD
jgi:hypothetical protein